VAALVLSEVDPDTQLWEVVFNGAPVLRPGNASPTNPPDTRPTMHKFALLFRATRSVDPADLALRNTAARDWALALRRDGTLRAASPLEDEGVTSHSNR